MAAGDTRFKKGQSGNPGGKPKWVREAKEICGAHSKEAIERLVYWMRNEDPRASIPATNAILDRALGKPKEYVDVEFNERLAEEMTDEELLSIASRRRDRAATETDGEEVKPGVH